MRLAVLSARGVDDAVYWRNLAPPLEDALASQAGATLVVAPPFRRPTFRAAKPAWLSAIRTARKADTVFWIQLHLRPAGPVWALAYTKPHAFRAALALDAFPSILADLPRFVNAQRLGCCFVAYRIPALGLAQSNPRRRYEWLPIGFNDRVFREQGLERDVYAFWMGRRYAPLHDALLRHCRERGLEYRYLEPPWQPIPLAELSRLCARARYFVAVAPDIEDPLRTGGTSPLTARFFEGLGAGCRLLGVRPRSGEFELLLPEEALVDCAPDGSDLTAVLERADSDPEFAAKASAACKYMHREHTWEHRAVHIYQRLLAIRAEDAMIAEGQPPSPAAQNAAAGPGRDDTPVQPRH
jgi:Glycosyl transferases group 1